jgi:hypothetical protein
MVRRIVIMATATLFIGVAETAHAVDGVIEINQASALAGGVTAGDAAGFPVTINQSGSYRLTGNLTLPNSNTTGIQIASPDVNIDLNGFGIFGPGTCAFCPATSCDEGTGSGVEAGPNAFNVNVRNGIVRGVGLDGLRLFFRGSVDNVVTSFNGGEGIHWTGGEGTVTGSESHANGGQGIRIEGGGVVSGNRVNCNRRRGILIARGPVVGNHVLQNGAQGIQVTETGTIENNDLEFNSGCAIEAVAATVAHNSVLRNAGGGICMSTSGSVIGNTLNANGNSVSSGKALALLGSIGISDNVLSNHGCFTTAVLGGIEIGHNLCDNQRSCTLDYCPSQVVICHCIF